MIDQRRDVRRDEIRRSCDPPCRTPREERASRGRKSDKIDEHVGIECGEALGIVRLGNPRQRDDRLLEPIDRCGDGIGHRVAIQHRDRHGKSVARKSGERLQRRDGFPIDHRGNERYDA